MTRKCAICKESNYKNTRSFFSAPKNPELRRKWQEAIDIDDYSVNDFFYVCSKHFRKRDIITHWVSGSPPHVISIKYKKCRLRPGAVPTRNIHPQLKDNKVNNIQNHLYEFLQFKPDSFLTSDKEDIVNTINECTEFKNHKHENVVNQSKQMEQSSEDESNKNTSVDDYKTQLRLSSNRNNKHRKTMLRDYNNLELQNTDNDMRKMKHKENINYDQLSQVKLDRSVNNSSYVSHCSEEDETSAERWDNSKVNTKNSIFPKCLDNTLNNRIVCIKEQSLNIVNKYDDSMYDNKGKKEFLFEDILEMCFEITLPRGWSCNVASKGHATTIVYLNMAMTKDGIPFLVKQVFVKTDMMLRCSVFNKEIDPIMYNLIKENKDNKVQCLLDIEELINKFHLRIICEGITDNFQEMNSLKLAYKDGIQWRHVLCPLILNNDSKRCSKCFMLSHMIKYKLRKSVYC
ncbi:PREDICTED: uncharacterized protein LOC107071538 [Polistes dominula]|uniref:Uncharacterized protein LOC107071538 n=1 Tax=Polistes dominula TaxID=743375 RepID=A0ABM1J0W0_POLDO|nr:PREDICTED: uncharacterized protein LOC107071538 [Polistes dominula]